VIVPDVAPDGISKIRFESVELITVIGRPDIRTRIGFAKPEPVTVTCDPTDPDVGEMLDAWII